jgi:hypothetical protein
MLIVFLGNGFGGCMPNSPADSVTELARQVNEGPPGPDTCNPANKCPPHSVAIPWVFGTLGLAQVLQ